MENRLSPRRLSGFDFATWRSAANDPIMRSPMIGLIALESSPDWDRLVDRFDRASRAGADPAPEGRRGAVGHHEPAASSWTRSST